MAFSTTTRPGLQEALGQSEEFLTFGESLSRVAPVERPVLIIGERGTGKELAASRLHFLSQRWGEPMVTLNCASLTPSLVESELFGHEAGAFTGARGRRSGRFEEADGGTLFLDEIGLIPSEVQEKILRVVEYGQFERVGGSRPVEVDVRIIGATNADLKGLAGEGRFKLDLLDRLAFEVLHLPPLRLRQGDVALLAGHFAARMGHELGREKVPSFSPSALAELETHPWPGNIRELKNVVERAVYRAETAMIHRIDFDPFASPYAPSATPPGARTVEAETGPDMPEGAPDRAAGPISLDRPFSEVIRRTEADMLKAALERTRYNQRRAAELLGLTYDQLRGILRRHGGPDNL